MLFKDITIIDENLDTKTHMYVGIKDDKIEYIGEKKPDEDYGDVWEGKGRLLMSGFFNAHAHSPMTLMRGYGENMVLQDWLEKKIFPFENRLTGEDVYWGTMLAMAESLRFGIISSSDMYYFTEDMVKAVIESGAKGNISRSIVNPGGKDLFELEAASEMKQAYEDFEGSAGGRIKIDMSLHAEYTSDEKTVKQLAEYTLSIGANMQVHVSETAFEHTECKRRHKMTPVEYLNKNGLFETPTTAAHCVWIEGDDFEILKEKGVTVAVNPVSNLKLASGVCNVPRLLDTGINVAIGTDSVASNNNLDFIEEMKTFAIISKERFKDPTTVTPKDALHAATFAGAKSQRRWDTGKLSKGYKADLIVLDTNVPNMHPVHNMINNVVYSSSGADVILTMVDGKVLYEKGEYKTIDMEKTIYNVNRSIERILNKSLVRRENG